MNKANELAAHVRGQLAKVVVGQREALDQLFLVLLVGGHALVEGVPGLAKTLAVKALADHAGGKSVARRIDTGAKMITSTNMDSPEIAQLLRQTGALK